MLVIIGEEVVTIDNQTLEQVVETTKSQMEEDTTINLSATIISQSKIVFLLKVDNKVLSLTDAIQYDIVLI